MQKAVLRLDLHDEKDKRKAMKIVSGFAGVDSVDINMKENKLTVTGAIDAVELVGKLRKVFSTEILSVGPAKEAQKKDDNKGNKNEQSKDPKYPFPYGYIQPPPPPPPPYFYGRSVSAEEDPNSCVIC
ncbi:heavy metal-associated isoprenylated plant protein 12-like isoform X7 [Rhodamnia argentea]|uniref:Heavy metal-associated isoprenylated plant protein 12-like isoform X7 n=1 Tax=Rhodamnia argentea TaxID=178133 RepID=A0ABM3GTR9_9MYRT|nr:heavy metal-associated isoprenylated plant protein 12-like isoform X7 [Rhodamnia argentea]